MKGTKHRRSGRESNKRTLCTGVGLNSILSSNGGRAGSHDSELDSPERLMSDLLFEEAGGPIRSHSEKINCDSSPKTSHIGSTSHSNTQRRRSEEVVKELASLLTNSNGFKEGGLIKKTMRIEYEGPIRYLVFRYTLDNVLSRLADVDIGQDLITRTSFGFRPIFEAGNTVSRNSPDRRPPQILPQHQRCANEHVRGLGYGSMNYNTPPCQRSRPAGRIP